MDRKRSTSEPTIQWRTDDGNVYPVVERNGEILIVNKEAIVSFLRALPWQAKVTVFVGPYCVNHGTLMSFDSGSGAGVIVSVEENGPERGQEFIHSFLVNEIIGVAVNWSPTL